ncbi:ABC transporter substrate-binding protein [Gaiella sp.]|jgi:branched-chain amino acid transport system substrate-binding protein|uniref:ABC transporter substrate-binding protein n=1 Tax=Gaiella sp. TaxID=2663207 RepID=UPI002E36A055|nr:ABC transporter substrate-binding protein [Gaiella sp.]HEX5583465.1 ABC transporter substrate-binding protein [Gaiella sp.]
MRFRLVAAVAAVASLVAAVGGSSAFGGSNATAAKGPPIKIGVLTSLTGNFAPWGIQFRAGAAMAVNEINRKGGVKGRLLNLSFGDDQSTPNGGIDAFRKLTQQDKVVSTGGVVASNVGLATARLAEQAKVPLFLLRAGDDTILTTQSRYTFRMCLPPAQEDGPPILDFAQARGVKSVGAIVADYAWGHAFKTALEDAFKGSDVKLNVQVAPLSTSDFTPYLRALGSVGLIVATGHPPGAGAILAQSAQLGMKAPVTGAYTPFTLAAKAGSAAYGRSADFKCINVASKAYRALAKRYLKTFPQNGFFEDAAMEGYVYVKIIAEAVGKVGTDHSKVAAYVHSHTFNYPGYAFPLKWTAWGEMVGPTPFLTVLTKGPPPDPALNKAGDWWPRNLSKSKPLTPYRPS